MIRTSNILQFGWRMDQRSLKQNYNKSLAMSLLEIFCFSCSSCVLRVFFVFEGLWWKFFGALEAWIHRVSLICGLLRFLEAFKLDSSELWDLGMWFGWVLFECFSYLKVCGGSSSGFWRLESVELRWFMVCWGFWRLLSLIPVTFEIWAGSLNDSALNVPCIQGQSSWSSWRLQGLILVEFQYFWIFFDAACALDGLISF